MPTALPARSLGRSGLQVSALGLGCMGMSWAYGTPDLVESEATLIEAIDSGLTLIDTAEVYGPWTNEEFVGRVLADQGRRDRVVLATKFGFRIEPGGRIAGLDSRPQTVRQAVEGSLRRLRTDRIDLLYQHRVDATVPIEETVGAMAELVASGKVRYLGLSEASATTLRRAQAVHPISVLQSEYSLWERGVETGVLPACRELGVGFVPYSPLGRGFLTGRLPPVEELEANDFRRNQPRLQPAHREANRARLARLEELARRLQATPAQVALAWLLAQGPDIVPIFGTTRRERLRENLAALGLRLAGCDQFLLDQVFERGATAGARYDERGMAMLDHPPG
jgi:aryl-alcohol dehydrogenase-like predicted oxidoreductase